MRKLHAIVGGLAIVAGCSTSDRPTSPLTPGEALMAGKPGAAGATLQATKTLDICVAPELTGIWEYSGVVAVWNEGATATVGLKIFDHIQNKTGAGQFKEAGAPYQGTLTDLGVVTIFGFTQVDDAVTFQYKFVGAPLTGDIRNVADVTITNHSGQTPGTAFGPSPKATYTGSNPPPFCLRKDEGGCTYTQGYWGSKPDVIWPSPYDRNAVFFLSGQTWQGVFDTSNGTAPGYYQLAHQYIAAVLNKANGAAVPVGVQSTIDQAATWLAANAPAACTAGGSCGTQKDWAATLDLYNRGVYPGGPAHCGNEDDAL